MRVCVRACVLGACRIALWIICVQNDYGQD